MCGGQIVLGCCSLPSALFETKSLHTAQARLADSIALINNLIPISHLQVVATGITGSLMLLPPPAMCVLGIKIQIVRLVLQELLPTDLPYLTTTHFCSLSYLDQ